MSLRTRLLIVLGVLVATYVVAALAIVSAQRDELISQVDARLTSLPPNALAGLEAPPPGQMVDDPAIDTQVAADAPFSDLYIAVVDSSNGVAPLLVGAPIGSAPDIAEAVDRANGIAGVVTIDSIDDTIRYRAFVLPQPGRMSWMVVAQPLTETDAAISRLVRTLAITGTVILIVLGVATFWILRLGLTPIARVTSAAEAIAAGDRSRRVDVRDTRTEAGKLGVAFNVMLDERDASENRLRQFVADASHELRTPITSVRGYLELFRQGAFREAQQLDDVVRRLSKEAARMNGLVEDLLALASLDEGRPLQQDPVDLGQLVRDAAQDAGATQPGRPLAVEAPADGPIVTGDEALLVQLVGILVSNALAHTQETVPVTLSAAAAGDSAVIRVVDRGPGLDAEAAAHVFDRFWRAESSRARKPSGARPGGAGLGLAIARSIADAHGGPSALDTAPGPGWAF
ncbi:MAG: HAMP domain-containing histidine kinase, partial [Thermomicrobiales bacterium]|nr:HAMP domain-containing histidine kinase [Thermomicrobiales bacterium]